MPKLRALILYPMVFALLGACERGGGFLDIPATMTTNAATADWPAFLPLDQILAEDLGAFELNQANVRALQGRVALLRKKAAILNDPNLSTEQRIQRLRVLHRRAG